MTELSIYVPADGTGQSRGILPKSAIVGSPEPSWPGRLPARFIRIDYEGRKYDQANIGTFRERLEHAADRHIVRYPTVARQAVPRQQVIEVGTFDTERLTIDLSSDGRQLLKGWLDVDEAALERELAHEHRFKPISSTAFECRCGDRVTPGRLAR